MTYFYAFFNYYAEDENECCGFMNKRKVERDFDVIILFMFYYYSEFNFGLRSKLPNSQDLLKHENFRVIKLLNQLKVKIWEISWNCIDY